MNTVGVDPPQDGGAEVDIRSCLRLSRCESDGDVCMRWSTCHWPRGGSFWTLDGVLIERKESRWWRF